MTPPTVGAHVGRLDLYAVPGQGLSVRVGPWPDGLPAGTFTAHAGLDLTVDLTVTVEVDTVVVTWTGAQSAQMVDRPWRLRRAGVDVMGGWVRVAHPADVPGDLTVDVASVDGPTVPVTVIGGGGGGSVVDIDDVSGLSSALADIDADVAAEVAARGDADTTLATAIDDVADDLTVEEQARTDGDALLSTAIDDLDAGLTASLVDEEAAREGGDDALATAIGDVAADLTAEQTARAAALASPSRPGGVGYRPPGLTDWFGALDAARTTPADVVVIGDSLADWGSLTSPSWPWRLGRDLARAAGTRAPGQQTVVASSPYASASSTGTANTTTTSGWGVDLANGQTVTHTAVCDAVSVVYTSTPGAGSVQVRIDGALVDTIDTDAPAKSGRLWTSGALTYGPHTVLLTAVGAATVDLLQLHHGTRTAGARVWNLGRNGWPTSNFLVPSRALDFIELQSPDLVLICTGNHDTDYAGEVEALRDAIGAVSPGTEVAVVITPTSGAITSAEVTAARPALNALGPVIDLDRIVADYATRTVDGTHPTPGGAESIAGAVSSVLTGDPIGRTAHTPAVRTSLVEVLGGLGPEARMLCASEAAAAGFIAAPTLVIGTGRMWWDGTHWQSVADNFRWEPAGVGSLELVGTPQGPTLRMFAGDAAAYPSVQFGSFFGYPYLAAGGSAAAADTYLTRETAKVWRVGLLSADGAIRAGRATTINARTTTGYTVANADLSATIVRNNAGASTQTWPRDSAATDLPVGVVIETANRGAGTVTHQAGAGATVVGATSQPTNTTARAQKIAADTWLLTS